MPEQTRVCCDDTGTKEDSSPARFDGLPRHSFRFLFDIGAKFVYTREPWACGRNEKLCGLLPVKYAGENMEAPVSGCAGGKYAVFSCGTVLDADMEGGACRPVRWTEYATAHFIPCEIGKVINASICGNRKKRGNPWLFLV